MMRKGQFFSLAGILIVIVLLVMLSAQRIAVEQTHSFRVTRAQIKTADTFVDLFSQLDAPRILQTTSKYALTSWSQSSTFGTLSFDEFKALLDDSNFVLPEYTIGEQLAQVQASLPSSAIEQITFDYALVQAEQVRSDVIRLTFHVNYTITSQSQTWSEVDHPYAIDISVYSLKHPVYNQIMTDDWTTDSSVCLVQQFLSQALPCIAAHGLKPPVT